MRVPSIAGGPTRGTRPAALICVVMAGTGLIVSIALGWPPPDGQLSITAMLPQLAALFALAAGMLSLFSSATSPSADASAPTESSTQQVSALQTMVWELRGILAEEKAKLATFQEVCGATAHDANVMSARMARLAEASLEAEQRLVAGTAAAEKAIRQPAAVVTWAAEAAQRIERALPEFAEIIRTSIAAQSEVLTPALEAAASRMVNDAGSAVQTFHAAVATAAAHMNSLGDRVGDVDAVLAQLPAAAAAVTSAAEKAAFTVAEASAALCADSASLGASGRETVHAAGALREEAETLRAAGQEIAGAERETMTSVTATIEAAAAHFAAIIADADAARQGSVSMVELASRLETAAVTLVEGISSLDAAGQRIAAKAEGASDGLDNAAGKVIAAAYQAAVTLAQASSALSETGATIGAAGRETEQAASTLRHEAETLRNAAQDVATTGAEAIRNVANTSEATASRLAEVIADADAARQGAVPMVVLTARLEHVAAALADKGQVLDDTSRQIAATGAGVAANLDTAAATLAEANAAISGGGSALHEAIRETAETVTALRTAAQDLANAEKSTVAAAIRTTEVAAARLAAVIADADAARRGSVAMVDLTTRLEQVAATVAERSVTLSSAGEQLAAAAYDTIGRIDAAASGVTTSTDQAIASLTEASAVLCADSASLDASGQETLLAASFLRQEAGILPATIQERLDAQRQTLDAAVGHWSSTLAESSCQIAATLNGLTDRLDHTAVTLEAVELRLANSGEAVSERLSATISRLDAIPNVAADMTSAMSSLQVETTVLAAVGRQIADAGAASTQAVNDIASRVEVSTASLDTVARLIGATADDMVVQIDRLAAAADLTHSGTAGLQDTAAQIAEATDRLRVWADTLPVEITLASLPDIAARLEATIPRLDQLDLLSVRLEQAVAELPAGDTQGPLIATLSGLSADVAAAVVRVESALSDHDKAGAALLVSVARVQAAATEAARAAEPDPLPEGVPVVLAATLRDLDGMAAQSETLLKQTEALAEAVLKGLAPTLPSLLGDRTPAILAGVQTTIKRLSSVATALALASDGPAAVTPVIRLSA